MAHLTDSKLKALKPGETATESLPGKGSGSIFFEARSSGVVEAYFRYVADGKRRKAKIGQFRRTVGGVGLGLAELRAEAARLSRLAMQVGDLGAHKATTKAAAEAERVELRRKAEEEARRGTFADLLDAYCDDLQRKGKVSASKARQIFDGHVVAYWPDLMRVKASAVRPEDIQLVLAGVLNRKPKPRGVGGKVKLPASNGMRSTADELRRYLQAAFNFAASSHLSAERVAQDGKRFDVNSNPAALIPKISGTGGGLTESLTPAVLGELLRRLEALEGPHKAISLVLLYTGGQRMRQLLGARWGDVEGGVLRLADSKGTKDRPWDHLIPLAGRVEELMTELFAVRSVSEAPGPFSLNLKVAANESTVGKIFSDTGRDMHRVGLAEFPFTWRHLRATCETLMAAQGISQEVRAWLLSHGRGGVQAKHYDRYAYLPEKRAALEQWGRYLDQLRDGAQGDNVVLLRRR